MTQHTFELMLAVFASTGFWQFLNAVIANKMKSKSVETTAILGLLHDKLYYLCNHYISKGSITIDEYENLKYLYEPYKQLGGNGTCERLMREIDKLPIEEGD